MLLSTDYAHAVAYLDRRRLPPYVSFIERGEARGLESFDDGHERIYVRTSDGAVVSFTKAGVERVSNSNSNTDNPFRSDWLFNPSCSTPVSEEPWHWNGISTIRFTLRATCSNDIAISHLYADPQTLQPVAIDGSVTDGDDAHMTVALEMRYTQVSGYTVPSEARVHAVGHGWLFWARERADVTYRDYAFYGDETVVRRQATGAANSRSSASRSPGDRATPTSGPSRS